MVTKIHKNHFEYIPAPVTSPELLGIPTAPTQEAGDNSTKIATTEYVKDEVTRLNTPISTTKVATTDQVLFTYLDEDGWTVDTTSVLVFKSGIFMTPDADYEVSMVNKTITFVNLCDEGEIITAIFNNHGSVMLQPKVKIQYADEDLIWSDTVTANVVYLKISTDGGISWDDPITLLSEDAVYLKADLISPAFTGIPTAPTATAGTNNTQIATTAYADAKVAETITDGITGIAPSQNVVFDALALKANLESPALTGTPTAPTAVAGTGNTQIATTAYTDAKVAESITDGVTGIAPSQDVVFDALALKANLESPALTGTPTAPTAVAGTGNTQVATTAYADAKVAETITDGVTGIAPSQNAVADALALKSNLESPAFTGTPTAPTAVAGTGNTQIATTAYADAKVAETITDGITGIAPSQNVVFDALALKANLESPALTGTPTAPTAEIGTNNTQVATTAFVIAAVGEGGDGTGNVVGPSSSTDSNFAAFDGITGKLIKDSTSKASDFATASHSHSNATTEAAGFMSAADKITLNELAGGSSSGGVSLGLVIALM